MSPATNPAASRGTIRGPWMSRPSLANMNASPQLRTQKSDKSQSLLLSRARVTEPGPSALAKLIVIVYAPRIPPTHLNTATLENLQTLPCLSLLAAVCLLLAAIGFTLAIGRCWLLQTAMLAKFTYFLEK